MPTFPEAGPAWTLEFYEENAREPVLDFLRGLDEVKEQALAAALRNILAYEGMVRHDAATILRERGLPVPANLDTAQANILLRVFCHAHGQKIVLLLAAYDKGKEPSAKRQNAEIHRAKQRLTRWKGSQRTSKRRRGKS